MNLFFIVVMLTSSIAWGHYYESSTTRHLSSIQLSKRSKQVWENNQPKRQESFELHIPHLKLKARFSTLVKSDFRHFDHGISYHGSARTTSKYQLTSQELQQGYWLGFQTLFEFEGAYDGINTYDRGIFSFGLLQANHKGEILWMMADFEQKHPELFRQYFGKYGIRLNKTLNPNSGEVKVSQIEFKEQFEGEEAWEAIAQDMELVGSFIASGHTPEMQECQRNTIVQKYLNPLMKRKVTFRGVNYSMADMLNTEKGRAAMMALAVKYGVTGAQNRFQEGLNTVSWKYNDFYEVDENHWLRGIVYSNKLDKKLKERIEFILEQSSAAYAAN